MHPARRSRPHGEKRRREIVETALAVFSEQGYGSTSMREIAARCKLTQSGLLHHFATKEQLLIEVIELRDRRIDQVVERSGATSFRDRVLVIAEHNARERSLSTVYSVLLAESLVPDSPAHAYFVDRYRRMRDLTVESLTDEQAAGRMRHDIDVETVTTTLTALLDGTLLQQQLLAGVDPVLAVRTTLDALTSPV